jgi:WD40 repeat protein
LRSSIVCHFTNEAVPESIDCFHKLRIGRGIAEGTASRVPSWQIINPSFSPDGQWLALPLTDGFTTNIWAISTRNGEWRQVSDFGSRPIFIARRVSWSPDGKSILAAVGEGDSDIVLLDGLIDRR